MRRLGIVSKGDGADLAAALVRLTSWAEERGVEILADRDTVDFAKGGLALLEPDAPVDFIVALGGDGTLLRAARLRPGEGIPVLGLNLGQLGFLTAAGGDELEASLDRVLAGDFALDQRLTLEATVVRADGEQGRRFMALNDFVIHKQGVARVTRLDLAVGHGPDVDEIGSFSGDGIILSTPTGSTAYNLSAGGPIIVPALECIVVTPIAPHTLALRPLVIPPDDVVRVRPLDRTEELVLTVDGQMSVALHAGDTVVVARGPVTVPLVRFPDQTFFWTLRRKLHWAAPPSH